MFFPRADDDSTNLDPFDLRIPNTPGRIANLAWSPREYSMYDGPLPVSEQRSDEVQWSEPNMYVILCQGLIVAPALTDPYRINIAHAYQWYCTANFRPSADYVIFDYDLKVLKGL